MNYQELELWIGPVNYTLPPKKISPRGRPRVPVIRTQSGRRTYPR